MLVRLHTAATWTGQMDDEESSLIARVILDGDRRAFGRLVAMHQSSIRGFLLRLTRGDGALADDLAQDTFLRAYTRIETFQGTGRFFSWLARIAYRNFLQHIRRKRPEETSGEPPEGVSPGFERASNAKLDMERAFRILSDNERSAITLCYSYGMSHGEASKVTGMPLGTIKSHIARGRAKLQAELRHWRDDMPGEEAKEKEMAS